MDGLVLNCPPKYTNRENMCVRPCEESSVKFSNMGGFFAQRPGNFCQPGGGASGRVEFYADTLTAEESKLYNQLYGMINMLDSKILDIPLRDVASSLVSGIVMMVSGNQKGNIVTKTAAGGR